jgi:hypothetical protein
MTKHQQPKPVSIAVLLLIMAFSLIAPTIWAQSQGHWENDKPKVVLSEVLIDNYQIRVSTTKGNIKIDGQLFEQDWKEADSIKQFYQNYPYDTGYAFSGTVVRMMRDDKYLYISAVCQDQIQGRYISTSLARDWNTRDTDGFQWVIDPFLDKTNGFGFAVSAYGAQREGLISSGGNGGINTSWDNKWYSAVSQHHGYWVMEAAIPFKSLRYKANLAHWRINFARTDYKRNEMSVWVPMFRNFSIANLGFTGKATFDDPVPKAGSNVSIIPYGNLRLNQEKKTDGSFTNKGEPSAGLDAKVGLGSATNLDLTINPDFSQVEVDRQVTNLSRFELFFPERRNFFLENQDVFDGYGSARVRPFFSRRIGIALDTALGLYVNNPILLGARLTGKLGQDWRLGVLAAQTANNPTAGNKGQNDVMISVQRRVFDRSFVSAFLINKQGIGSANGLSFGTYDNDFSRNAGLEYNLISADNRWTGKAFYHLSQTGRLQDSRLIDSKAMAAGINLAYNDRNLSFEISAENVGSNYTADLGFRPRSNFTYLSPEAGYVFLCKKGPIASHGPYLAGELYLMPNLNGQYRLTDHNFYLSYYVADNSTRSLRLAVGQDFIYLFAPFNPSVSSGGDTLSRGSSYTTQYVRGSYASDIRKPIFLNLAASYGGFYVGTKFSADATLNYRLMPYMALGITANYNRLNLPETWGSKDLWLLGPNINLTMTNNLFFKVYYQYNTQINNTNINARLQWRYSPASDLFIVYTDNYTISNNMQFKNRALVLKLTYWLNA